MTETGMLKAYIHGVEVPERDEFDSDAEYTDALMDNRQDVEHAIVQGLEDADYVDADRVEIFGETFTDD